MKKTALASFDNIPFFTIEGFKQVSGIEPPHTVRVMLHRWAQSGEILPLKKGLYMSRHFHEQHWQDVKFSSAVSAIILPNSYVSLEYVLQQYNLLTDVTYPVTCITTKNTRTIVNSIGTFWYRSIHPDLFTGFEITEYLGIRLATASLAKALFDYLYLRPIPTAYRSQKINLAEELRLNLDEMDDKARKEFAGFIEHRDSRKMHNILENFRRYEWQP
jgi:predicted transcriptional regulator of viral defense system